MRNRAVLALTFTIAAACGGDWPSPPPKIGQQSWSGPDAILIRAPLAGGPARAYRWGRDSAVWTSADPAPALTRFLAFDEDQGVMLYVDAKGTPGGLDLRLRTVTPAARAPLQSLASVDGWAAFGISGKQEVTRLTPSGDWKHGTAFTPQMLLPQPDGSLIMLNDLGDRSVLRRLIPPESRIVDTASVPTAT
ncbi:MAG: hypothetical protein FJ202_10060, partial [Gemmatimonadetes bacterium]|nr:hypothetical protein [Gemmatimonadota bacterium]